MDDMLAFDSDFVEEGRKLFREMGVPNDIARIYLRIVPLLLMGIDEETAKELACRLEDEAQEGAAE
jgi:hypothetical protein